MTAHPNELIAAIIITYNPDKDFEDRLQNISKQVRFVIIVDNASEPDIISWMQMVVPSSTRVIQNTDNNGIAIALNQGVQTAISFGCDWVLTLDQDTVVDEDIVERLCKINRFAKLEYEKIGAIGANSRSPLSGKLYNNVLKSNRLWTEQIAIITSGCLLSVLAYQKVGLFREDFFIEGVDTEYCLRLRKYGYTILMSNNPLMTHAAGRMEEKRFWGRTILITNHTPYRYFLMIRNVLKILYKYGFREPVWSIKTLIALLKMVLKIIFFEEDKLRKIWFIWKGLFFSLYRIKK